MSSAWWRQWHLRPNCWNPSPGVARFVQMKNRSQGIALSWRLWSVIFRKVRQRISQSPEAVLSRGASADFSTVYRGMTPGWHGMTISKYFQRKLHWWLHMLEKLNRIITKCLERIWTRIFFLTQVYDCNKARVAIVGPVSCVGLCLGMFLHCVWDIHSIPQSSSPAFTLWWTNILPWKITIFNGKIHYFYGQMAIFHSKLLVHQHFIIKVKLCYGAQLGCQMPDGRILGSRDLG